MPFEVPEVHVLCLNFPFQFPCATQTRQFFVEHDAVALVSALCPIHKRPHLVEDVSPNVFVGKELNPQHDVFIP